MPFFLKASLEYYQLIAQYAELRSLFKALKEPYSCYRFLRRMRKSAGFVQALTQANFSEIIKYFRELHQDVEFHHTLQKKVSCFGLTGIFPSPLPGTLYAIIRIEAPDKVVETGVASGISSAYILHALRKNKFGRLYSIDLPSEVALPVGKQTGWLIPDALRPRWTLILGKSSQKLSPLLESLGSIDIFIHDSEHSYDNMMWEYKTAYPFLKVGGILLSHDIWQNQAFADFCKHIGTKLLVMGRVVGGLRKIKEEAI